MDSKKSLLLGTAGVSLLVCGLYVGLPSTASIPTLSASEAEGPSLRASGHKSEGKMNVLFMYADDFRPQISAMYPDSAGFMHTPGLDRLYEDSFTTTEFVPATAWCCPSRASTLTSRRPATTEVYEFEHFRAALPDVTTIPGHFRQAGYVTRGAGKIFHNTGGDTATDPVSWDIDFYLPETYDWYQGGPSWWSIDEETAEEKPLPDEMLTDWVIDSLEDFAESGKNFFLAPGFFKPHLPLVMEEKWLDYYPEDSFEIQPLQGALRYVAENFPEIAYTTSPELHGYEDIEGHGDWNETIDDTKAAEVRRAYFACVSQTDSHIERILDALDDLGLADNTIVSFMGDHGWALGHHTMWEKQANTKVALNTPLLVRVPGLTDGGIHTRAFLEGVDLMPTLAELAGVPRVPRCPDSREESQKVSTCTEGQSFVPLMYEPDQEWRTAVFSQFQKMKYEIMGYSMMSDHWHAVAWVRFDYGTREPDFDYVEARELYNLVDDPDENRNIVDEEPGIFNDMFEEIQAEYASGQIIEVDAEYDVYGEHAA